MPIDLGVLGVEGQALQRFGQQVRQTGYAITGLAANLQNQQEQLGRSQQVAANAFLEAQAFNEIMQAKSYVYESLNQFNEAIKTDSEHERYKEKWDARAAEIDAEVGRIVKSERGKMELGDWWLTEKQKETLKVYETARSNLVAQTEATFQLTTQTLSRDGNEEGLVDAYQRAFRAGLFTDKTEALKRFNKDLRLAHYNNIYNRMQELDPEDAISLLRRKDAEQVYGLTLVEADGGKGEIPRMIEALAGEADYRKTQAAEVILKKASEADDAFWSKYYAGQIKTPGEIAATLTAVRGTEYEKPIREVYDKYRRALGEDIDSEVKRDRDVRMLTILEEIAQARAVGGTIPYTSERLIELRSRGEIDQEHYEKIREQLAVTEESKMAAGVRARIYGVMRDTGRDPDVEVPQTELDAMLDREDLSGQEHKELSGLLFDAVQRYQTAQKTGAEKARAEMKAREDFRAKRDQDVRELRYMIDLMGWKATGYQGQPVWDEKMLPGLVEKGDFRDDQARRLLTEFQKRDESPAYIDMASRLYGATNPSMKDGKAVYTNPALIVSEQEITEAQREGRFKEGEFDRLQKLRLDLQKEHESRPNTTSEEWEYDAAGVIYDPKLEVPVKQKWLIENRSHYTGDDYSKWWGRISLYNGDPKRKAVLDVLSDFFRQAAAGPEVTETRIRELTIEGYYAKETMEKLFIKYPDKTEKWDEALNSLLSDRGLRDIEDRLSGRFAPTVGIPDWRRLDILEAGREQELLATNPAMMAQRALREQDIQQREHELVISKVRGVKIDRRETDETGESRFYATNGMVYTVTIDSVDGRNRRSVYGARVGAGDWTLIGRE